MEFSSTGLFLDLFIDMICSRCSYSHYVHHEGKINNFLMPKIKLDNSFFENYFNDTEHGFFHGLMSCYICFLINKYSKLSKKISLEKVFASLLMHDFLKTNSYSQEDHDKLLVNFYDKLLKETYIHSNPEKKYENSYLVISDRIELSRYDDHKEWVNEKYYDIFKKLDKDTINKIIFFYKHTRKILLYFYKNRNSIFIRHGLEKLNKSDIRKSAIFPPKDSYLELDNGYSIEIDRQPFGFIPIKNNHQMGYCSNHGRESSWNKVKGFMTIDDFNKFGGKVISSNERDHLYAISKIELDNWIFLYQQVNIKNKQVKELFDNDIRIIPQNIIFKFFELVKLLSDRIIVLNYHNYNT